MLKVLIRHFQPSVWQSPATTSPAATVHAAEFAGSTATCPLRFQHSARGRAPTATCAAVGGTLAAASGPH